MSNFKEKCLDFFGTSDFYEVLNVKSDATEREIKKAYHKVSLSVHPDRVHEHQKEAATEKFKVLGRIYTILQDKDKRKIYDDCGDFDEDADSTFNWMEYWASTFKKIEIADIEKYKKEYIGSEMERNDIKRAYTKSKGSMNMILELVPFSDCDSEPRIIEIVRKMVDNEEVEEYQEFFNESKIKKMRRRRKWEKERKEAEMINTEEFEQHMEELRKRRHEAFAQTISDLEQKYAPKKARKSVTDGSEKKKRAARK